MFHYISGTVEIIEANLVVLDVSGVGYAINTSLTSSSSVKKGETAKFYTFLNVKEELFDLYGFHSQEELHFFKQLLSISGVGAKAAIAILSVASPHKLALAIVSGDEKLITQANGIGKKIAQRVILELRDKLAKNKGNLELSLPDMPQVGTTDLDDALSALEVLGYPKNVVLQTLGGTPLDGLGTEEIIRVALKKLM